jgi:hypothetical protein
MLILMLIIVFAVLAAGMWFLVLGLLSQLSGWKKLASLYSGRRVPSGKRFLLQGGKVGAVIIERLSDDSHFLRGHTYFRLTNFSVPTSAVVHSMERTPQSARAAIILCTSGRVGHRGARSRHDSIAPCRSRCYQPEKLTNHRSETQIRHRVMREFSGRL